jgi:hypothetical protein
LLALSEIWRVVGKLWEIIKILHMEVKLKNGNSIEIKSEDYELPLSLNNALKLPLL